MATVLACVDLSSATEAVVRAAARVAVGFDSSLHLLHVAAGEPVLAGYDKDEIATFKRGDRAQQLLDEHHELRDLAATIEADGVTVVPLLEMGPTAETIVAVADHLDADVIAVGSHGHGRLHHLVVGSVSSAVLKSATRPVLVVPVRDAD